MTREIRLRAWDKEKKRMWWNVQNAYDTLGRHDIEDPSDPNRTKPKIDFFPCSFGEVLKDKDLIVMQLTGIRDSSGKEIWEGDIVSVCIEQLFDDVTKIGFIEYCAPAFMIDFPSDGVSIEITDRENVSVIGNIFENEELLK